MQIEHTEGGVGNPGHGFVLESDIHDDLGLIHEAEAELDKRQHTSSSFEQAKSEEGGTQCSEVTMTKKRPLSPQHMATKAEKEELLHFKKQIDGFLKGKKKYTAASIKDVLNMLRGSEVTFQDLETTGIGFSIKKLRTECNVSEIQGLAKTTLKGWKRQMQDKSVKGSAAKKQQREIQMSASSADRRAPILPDGVTSALNPNRLACAQGIFTSLYKVWQEDQGKGSSALERVGLLKVQTTALLIEEAAHQLHPASQRDYASVLRSLSSNLVKNVELFCEVLRGIVTAAELVVMSPEQLAPAALRMRYKKMTQDSINERRSDYEEANQESTYKNLGIYEDHVGMHECSKCKSTNTTFLPHNSSFEHVKFWSMGSAEEPATCTIRCLSCGHRWKE
jgi:hypothetical protein